MEHVGFSSVNDSVLIGGCGRSGTSILGKLIGSGKNVEYAYDPPMLFELLARKEQLSNELFKQFFITYLYDEFFLNSIAGRNLNFNKGDLTYIGNTKSDNEIELKLSKGSTRNELIRKSTHYRLAFKVTDSTFAIEHIKSVFPKNRTVIIYREPNQVISSLVKKQWFTDESLSPELTFPPLMPCRIVNGVRVPYWVEQERIEDWIKFNITERSSYYYHISNRSVLKNLKHVDALISYQELIRNPKEVARDIFERFNLVEGEKTEEILNSIRDQESMIDKQLDNLSTELRNEVESVYDKLNTVR